MAEQHQRFAGETSLKKLCHLVTVINQQIPAALLRKEAKPLRFRPVPAVIVPADREAARIGRRSESFVTRNMFAEAMKYLDDGAGFVTGVPKGQRYPVTGIGIDLMPGGVLLLHRVALSEKGRKHHILVGQTAA